MSKRQKPAHMQGVIQIAIDILQEMGHSTHVLKSTETYLELAPMMNKGRWPNKEDVGIFKGKFESVLVDTRYEGKLQLQAGTAIIEHGDSGESKEIYFLKIFRKEDTQV